MIAVIGGSGLDQIPGAQVHRRHNFTSKYGPASDAILELEVDGQEFLFLARHAADHHIAPHLINYRANIWALHKLGVTQIFSVNASGGIHPEFTTGDLVVPDQLIDYTYAREFTFFDGVAEPLKHVDFTEPFSDLLRARLIQASELTARKLHEFGVYACMQGPRLETRAEVQRLKHDGADLVGMTAMPEAILARELGIDYASICMIVNPAAGLSEALLSIEDIEAECRSTSIELRKVLLGAIEFVLEAAQD